MNTTMIPHLPASVHTSDVSIHERAISLLHGSGHQVLGQIDCRVHQGVIELSGNVPSYYLKLLAQATALRVETARGVCNRVRVG
jgi:osmotically-inducible protein OsmY